MKKIIIILFFVASTFALKAQSKYAMAELTYSSTFGKVSVAGYFDEGIAGKKADLIKDAQGNTYKASSVMEMLNFLCAKGYKVVNFVRQPNKTTAAYDDYIFVLEKI